MVTYNAGQQRSLRGLQKGMLLLL